MPPFLVCSEDGPHNKKGCAYRKAVASCSTPFCVFQGKFPRKHPKTWEFSQNASKKENEKASSKGGTDMKMQKQRVSIKTGRSLPLLLRRVGG